MFNVKNRVIAVFAIFLLLSVSFLYGRYSANQSDDKAIAVDSRTILNRIQDNVFLVTKTVYLNEENFVEVSYDAGWKDLLWGEKVNVRGLIRSDVGINVQKMIEKDIEVDDSQKKVRVDLPPAEILNASLEGDLMIETEKGVFRAFGDLFARDKNEEYNIAKEKLIGSARQVLSEDKNIHDGARQQGMQFIEFLIKNIDSEYTVIFN